MGRCRGGQPGPATRRGGTLAQGPRQRMHLWQEVGELLVAQCIAVIDYPSWPASELTTH